METDLTLQARLLMINVAKKTAEFRKSFTDIEARYNGDLTRAIAVVSIGTHTSVNFLGQGCYFNNNTFTFLNIRYYTAREANLVKLKPHDQLRPLAPCLPGTRIEIIGEIMSWASNSNTELLWLNGIPGSGKSSLMSTIADCAREMGKHSRLGAFVRFDSKTMKDSSHVITSLAYKLAQFDDRIGDQISKAVKEFPDFADRSLDFQFKELIVKSLGLVEDLKDEGPIVVLADALDKLEPGVTRTDLLKVLAGGFGAELPFMRLIISSQPQAEIVSIFDSTLKQHIHPYPLDVSAGDDRLDRDIRLYFEHKFREINNPEFHALCRQHNAITKLTECACGLFINASTTAESIKSNPTELLTVLNASGPTALEAALDSDSISPGITSTTAIPVIYATDSTVNAAGRDQTNITYVYNVDPNCNQGIWTNHPATQTHQSSRKNLPVAVRCHPISELSWSSRGSPGRHRFVVHQRSAFRTMEGNG
jgi:NACHT domain